jgi:hypothetical protein
MLALFRAAPGERVDRHSDWFTLRDAQLHIRPYTWPYLEIATAAMISPSGPRLAGALGTSLLSLSMSVPGGYAALENAWEVVRDQAAKVLRRVTVGLAATGALLAASSLVAPRLTRTRRCGASLGRGQPLGVRAVGSAAAMASCCWSMDCWPVDTRRYAAVLMVIWNRCGPTIHPVSDHRKAGLACDTRKSDSSTSYVLMPALRSARVRNL